MLRLPGDGARPSSITALTAVPRRILPRYTVDIGLVRNSDLGETAKWSRGASPFSVVRGAILAAAELSPAAGEEDINIAAEPSRGYPERGRSRFRPGYVGHRPGGEWAATIQAHASPAGCWSPDLLGGNWSWVARFVGGSGLVRGTI
jgi:hypothetical protein